MSDIAEESEEESIIEQDVADNDETIEGHNSADDATPMDVDSDESTEGLVKGTLEAYVEQELLSNMPLPSCV